MWSEQGRLPHQVTSGHPGGGNSSAAALLSYDVPHRAPWDWRVSLYTWTKGIAAGTYLVALLLVLGGAVAATDALWTLATPIVAGGFLGLTGLILVLDLEHPLRFGLIFTRPRWRSWLVRGAFIIAAYGLVLAAHFGLGLAGAGRAALWLGAGGGALAVATAGYTAYLFAQARARDLWQSPLLPPHLVVQALLAGAAALSPLALLLAPRALPLLLAVLAGSAAVHLLMALAEITLDHPTAHARLAAREMYAGRFAAPFWGGAAAVAVALLAPAVGPLAAPFALAGLLAHEHAHVQAGQAVPLA